MFCQIKFTNWQAFSLLSREWRTACDQCHRKHFRNYATFWAKVRTRSTDVCDALKWKYSQKKFLESVKKFANGIIVRYMYNYATFWRKKYCKQGPLTENKNEKVLTKKYFPESVKYAVVHAVYYMVHRWSVIGSRGSTPWRTWPGYWSRATALQRSSRVDRGGTLPLSGSR